MRPSSLHQIFHQGDDEPAGDDGCDLPADVGPGGVHQQEVVGVLLPAHLVDHAGGHGEGGDARRSDHGVDLLPGEQVQHFGEQHAAHGVKHKAHKAQGQDQQGLPGDEDLRLHPEGHG